MAPPSAMGAPSSPVGVVAVVRGINMRLLISMRVAAMTRNLAKEADVEMADDIDVLQILLGDAGDKDNHWMPVPLLF